MARYNLPHHPDDNHQRQKEAQRIAAIGQQIGAPLRDLSDQVDTLTKKIQSNDEKNQTEEKQYRSKSLKQTKWSIFFYTAFAFLNLVVLIAYVCTTYLQWIELGKTNQINQEALISVQRAFVNLKTIGSKGLRNNKGIVEWWQFFPQWENSGTTPTKTMRQHVNLGNFNTPLSAGFDFPDEGFNKSSKFVLAPKAAFSTGELVISASIPIDVVAGKSHLYSWGWAVYRDVFERSKPHLTEFCVEVTVAGGNLTTGEEVQFSYPLCDFHNCTDEECGDYGEIEKKLEDRNQFEPPF